MDTHTGTVRFYRKRLYRPVWSPSWEWRSEPFGQRLQEATGLPAVVLNDADAHAVYEHWFGVGQETAKYAVLLIREGVGGSLVVDNELFDGPLEIGNFPVFLDGNECDCGKRGCLEVTAGTTGIVTEARMLVENTDSIDSIEAAARLVEDPRGDSKVDSAFTRAGYGIARGIGVLLSFANPGTVVLYAPAVLVDEANSMAARIFLEGARRFGDYASHDDFRDCQLLVRVSQNYDGAQGVAAAALQRIFAVQPAAAAAVSEENR